MDSNSPNKYHLIETRETFALPDERVFENVVMRDIGNTVIMDDKIAGFMSLITPEKYVVLYEEIQFHIHAPSEHTVDGEHYDMELHIVHLARDETHASVLGIFFDVEAGGDETNPYIE